MTGPPSSEPYFRRLDEFIAATLGDEARRRYRIILGDPRAVARTVAASLDEVREYRARHGDAYYFNWRLVIDREFQRPFAATHESMRALDINEDLPKHDLAVNLRRAFSGMVSGNVREDTAALVEAEGPFQIKGSERYMKLLDELLEAFIAQGRMKIVAEDYRPCYKICR